MHAFVLELNLPGSIAHATDSIAVFADIQKTLASITLFFCPCPVALYWLLGIQIHVFLYMAERIKVFAPA